MAFQFQRQNCIAVGTFNIHVIHPRWLVQQGIVQRDHVPIRTETSFTIPGFRFRTDPSTLWTIEPQRIIVESTNSSFDCGSPVAKILRQLRHTPVSAVGANAIFVSPIVEGFDDICRIGSKYTGKLRLANRGVGLSFTETAARSVTILLRAESVDLEEQLELTLNTHGQCSGEEAEQAAELAMSFTENVALAKQVARDTFGDRLKYDAS